MRTNRRRFPRRYGVTEPPWPSDRRKWFWQRDTIWMLWAWLAVAVVLAALVHALA
jgi:hypothetical protein